MGRLCHTVLSGFMVISGSSMAAESAKPLEERIKDLELQNAAISAQYQQLEEKIDTLQSERPAEPEPAFMKVSGYADVEFRFNSKAGEEPGFRLHHFSLFFTKKISEKWKFFSEIEYEDAPSFEAEGQKRLDAAIFKSFEGKIFLEAMNIDYLMMPQASFRVGRFFTPTGIWSVDHYPPFVPTQVLPAHIRKIFPQLVDGGLVYGRIDLGEAVLKYDTYIGNGEENPGSGDKNSEKAFGAKLALYLPMLKHFEIGFSYYQDTLNNSVEKSVVGAHAKLNFWSLTWQSEYAKGKYAGVDKIDREEVKFDQEGYYSQLMYSIGKFAFGYRYDFFADNIGLSDEFNEKITNSLFANVRVVSDVVIKIEYHNADMTTDLDVLEYDEVIASIVVNL